jgi:hypothetical protein
LNPVDEDGKSGNSKEPKFVPASDIQETESWNGTAQNVSVKRKLIIRFPDIFLNFGYFDEYRRVPKVSYAIGNVTSN